jgi:hypothetical protein
VSPGVDAQRVLIEARQHVIEHVHIRTRIRHDVVDAVELLQFGIDVVVGLIVDVVLVASGKLDDACRRTSGNTAGGSALS